MYYVWSVSDYYPNRYYFDYDHNKGPSYLEFLKGTMVNNLTSTPTFRIKGKFSKERLLSYDYFMTDSPLLISPKFANLIRSICPNDIQLIDAEVWVNDGKLEGYAIPNVIQVVPCVDFEKSTKRPMLRSDPSSPLIIDKPVFLDGELTTHMVARVKENIVDIVVSTAFIEACKKAKIKGSEFLPNGVRSYEM